MHDQYSVWEKEIETAGVIADEEVMLDSLRVETNSVQKSRLLSLAALSRLGSLKDNTLTRVWMEHAIKLDPQNEKAKAYLLQFELLKMRDLFAPLVFPTIRETDNRTAKKKTAEEYIQICQTFLDQAEDTLKRIQEKAGLALKLEHTEVQHQYEQLEMIYRSAIDTVAALLRAADEYDRSITGVFHTALYYEDLKAQQSRLEQIQKDWSSLFEKQAAEPAHNKSENALDELKEMIGLEEVKNRVNDFYRFLKYQKHRKESGFQIKDEMSLNMVLTGNPGTGKTTLARLLAKIYHELGVMPGKEVIEADRSQLVGAYVGQTEENVRAAVERAAGGVLFIDEAYSLKREGQAGNDYGQTAIDTLVSLMTGNEYGGRFAVILAGYPDEMRKFIDANPGLRSRFPASNFIHLPNYTDEELIRIAEKIAEENDYVLTKDAKIELQHRLEQERVDETFGNARTVRNLVLDAIFKKGADPRADHDDIMKLTLLVKEDFIVRKTEKLDPPNAQLNHLIGLDTIKKEMNSLLAFVKMQQYRRKNGLPNVPIQLHAVFTGNPGTGKTTVAKIYAEMLRECGVLKRGHVIVTGRADFVAGYVGQTAGKSKKKIREALGGVLFIDEAYSLLSETKGDFGKEVIDTLVDEMTKHNENLVIILAGYPDEMDKLLESNPGLRSRFKKFFFFPDYTIKELLEIMDRYANRYDYHLSPDAKETLLESLSGISVQGNGRFAANLVDEIIQAQALRLMAGEPDKTIYEKALMLETADVETALRKMGIEGVTRNG